MLSLRTHVHAPLLKLPRLRRMEIMRGEMSAPSANYRAASIKGEGDIVLRSAYICGGAV